MRWDFILKAKKCKWCKNSFTQSRPLQRACSIDCALQIAKQEKITEEKKDFKKRKEKLKTKADFLKEAQIEFNKYIRLRDKNEPCISCGRFHLGQWHAGHYRSVGAAPHLRFDEKNVHKQCAPCNNHKSGNVIEYRIRLIAKIGITEVERIESDNKARHFTVDEVKEIKLFYKNKCKEIENGKR